MSGRAMTLLGALALILVLAVPAWAGWVQVETDGDKTLIQDGKIKMVEEEAEELWMVMDFKKGEVLAVRPGKKVYARASLDQFCAIMAKITAELRKMMGMAKGQDAVAVEISDQGPGPEIAGLATRKYEVKAGGKLKEEIWLAEKAPFLKDFDPKLVARAVGCGAAPGEIESSPRYQELMGKGWVMRSKYHEDGETDMDVDVESLEEAAIPAAEFTPPAGYTQVDLEKALSEE